MADGVVTCASCGEANRGRARFCDHCGGELRQAGERPPSGNRTVTILDVDLVGSTRLSERLSSEAFPKVVKAFYDVVDKAVAEHGGTVENHVGDGVLAVFGRPEPGVDDALRAVRAALTIRSAMPDLNRDVAEWGADLRVHSAVNTGEVSLAALLSGEKVVLADPANVCAKLNENARDGQILIGEATWHLVRDDVRVNPGDPLTLRLGSREAPVQAWRVLGLEPEGSQSSTEARMVGRERYMAQLGLHYDRVVDDRCCVLVTILGPAGIGKSRLVAEFLGTLGDGDCFVLQGRCLPYGDAIASRPIEQMLRTAAGVLPDDDLHETERKLLEVIADPSSPTDGARGAADQRVTALVARMLHVPTELSGEPGDRLFALQQFFERMAELRPLVLVIDGLHDAQAPLVEFIEHLAGALSEAPVLLICMARSEFFERRAISGMTLLDAASMLLKPLDEEEAEEVILQILRPEPARELLEPIAREVLEPIARAAGGNPLHLRHLVSMLVEQGRLGIEEGHWRVRGDLSELQTPPKIDAVLGTRLGRLGDFEKLVIERAAVVGERFSEADLVALLIPELSREQVQAAMRELVRRNLVQRDPAALAAGQDMDGYTFDHMLIQDSAYRRMDGETRAELHARYARWLQEHASERAPESEGHDHSDSARIVEQVGYHFASAYEELLALRKREDAITRDLARQAGEHLARAGHLHAAEAALLRNGEKPLRRALALLPKGHPARLSVWLDLADVLRDHDPAAAEREYAQVIGAAETAGDKRVEQHARLGQIEAQWVQHPLEGPQALRGQLEDAIREFERQQDTVGLANAYRLRANVDYSRGLSKGALQDVRHALALAERSGDERLAAKIIQLYCVILFWGPTPLAEVRPRVEERLAWASDRELQSLEAFALTLLARIAVLQGDIDEAQGLLAQSKVVAPLTPRRRGGLRREAPVAELLTRAAVTLSEALVEIGAGDLPAAEKVLTESNEALEREGKNVPRANVAAMLARVLLLQGDRDEEAEQHVEQCMRLALDDQVDVQIKWRSARARLLARAGRLDEAERLADEAVTLAEDSEQPGTQAEAHFDKAEVLMLAGKAAAAAGAARKAADLYEAKGCTVAAAESRELLRRLEAS
jgi:class 3 adenylate cyclase/tetratricopeptide (TPR) repeat protein